MSIPFQQTLILQKESKHKRSQLVKTHFKDYNLCWSSNPSQGQKFTMKYDNPFGFSTGIFKNPWILALWRSKETERFTQIHLDSHNFVHENIWENEILGPSLNFRPCIFWDSNKLQKTIVCLSHIARISKIHSWVAHVIFVHWRPWIKW